MSFVIDAWLVLVVAVAGWMTKAQVEVLEYVLAENRVLREQLRGRGKRRSLSDDQRRCLAVHVKALGREYLVSVAAHRVSPAVLHAAGPRAREGPHRGPWCGAVPS